MLGNWQYGNTPYGTEGEITEGVFTKTQGFLLQNNMFSTLIEPLISGISLNTIKHNKKRHTWEDLTIKDSRIANYPVWMYPFTSGVYISDIIDFEKIYYDVRLKVDVDLTQVLTDYTADSLQMNMRGRAFIDISGKCNIMQSRSKYDSAFNAKKDETNLLEFRGFWIDSNNLYIYLSTDDGKIQKRKLSDLSLIDECTNYNVDTTFSNPIIEGITGDSTYIYYTIYRYISDANTISYVVKRRQSDLGLEKTQNTFTTALKKPQGIWTNGTLLFICDYGNNRVIKCNASDFGSASIYSTNMTKVARIYGD